MATLSSILAWKIPWTEESGGLQFKREPTVIIQGTLLSSLWYRILFFLHLFFPVLSSYTLFVCCLWALLFFFLMDNCAIWF